MTRRQGLLGAAVLASLVGLAATSCSGNKEAAPGQLMVAIQTDMAIPKDVDIVRIEVAAYGNLLFGQDYAVGPTGLRIPATLAIVAGKDPATPVRIRVIARKSGVARTLREVVTTVPPDRIATLRMPIHWLCDGMASEPSAGDVRSSCPTGQTCAAGACRDTAVSSADLETYSPEGVFGGASGPGASGTCFDTVGCFSKGQQAALDPVSCSIDAPGGTSGLNVAVLLPAGGAGICGPGACLVPLDADSAEGWRSGGGRIVLPPTVCQRVKDGKAQGVAVTSGCATKTARVPTCGPWSSVESLPGEFDAGPPAPLDADAGLDAAADRADATQDAAVEHLDAGQDAVADQGDAAKDVAAEQAEASHDAASDPLDAGQDASVDAIGMDQDAGADVSETGQDAAADVAEIDQDAAADQSLGDQTSDATCADTQNDPLNCGWCGHVCDGTNGTPGCQMGMCRISCNSGWGNCDSNVDNGCETSVTTPSNCGTCGKTCTNAHGTSSCAGTECSAVCDSGWADCDANPDNGCETGTQADVAHCGSCTKACSGAHGTPSCVGGTCAITCSQGWDNCDGNADNGCEVDVDTSQQNCGGCGKPCSAVHAVSSCVAGKCGIASCNQGWSNCDGNVSNGCEAATGQCSCAGLSAVCGLNYNQDCCSSILVPGGAFYRSYDAVTYAQQNAPATVSSFRLDSYEISVNRFRTFVQAYPGSKPVAGSGRNPSNAADTGWDASWNPSLPADAATLMLALKCGTAQNWTDTAQGYESMPINCLTWFEAFAFCIWDGGRLPTEAEWNFAAAGGGDANGQRVYPWSQPSNNSTINSTNAVYLQTRTFQVGFDVAYGSARWGHMEMAGNVAEWVLDLFGAYPLPCTNCALLTGATNRVVRGGGFDEAEAQLLVSARDGTNLPGARRPRVGSRCARPGP